MGNRSHHQGAYHVISSCPPFSHYQVLIHIDVVFNSSPNLFFVTLICMVKSVLTSLIYVCMCVCRLNFRIIIVTYVHALYTEKVIILCVFLLVQAGYLLSPQSLWEQYPHTDMPLSLKFYMLTQVTNCLINGSDTFQLS